MQVATATRDIERHAIGSEKKFSINVNGRAFKILSSSLYKNKILAVVRELSCNAYDSHVAAGKKDKPFFVHLPNSLESYFSVRDEGTGLSNEDILNILPNYFVSTKQHSNDMIGCLGLGSKSPFSYVDAYTLTSCFEGVKTEYAMYLDETGEPNITEMSKLSTNNENGIEFSMPVKNSSDYREFNTSAINVLSRFSTRPIVVGNPSFRFHDSPTVIQGDRWKITQDAIDGEFAGAVAIMGQVAYPIVADAIRSLSERTQKIYAQSLEIEFPMGTLDFTAGREDLSYDPKTLKMLEDRAQEISNDCQTAFQKSFDACTSMYEAKMLYGKMTNSILTELIGKLPLFHKGEEIKSNYFEFCIKEYEDIVAEKYYDSYHKYRKTVFKGRPKSDWNSESDSLWNVHAFPNTLILIDDQTVRGSRMKINLHRRNFPDVNLIVLTGKDAESFRKNLDGIPVEYVSNLPKPVAQKRVTSVTPIGDGATLDLWGISNYRGRSNNSNHFWSYNKTIDINAGGIYINRKTVQVNSRGRIVKHALVLGLITKDTQVHGVSAKIAAKLAKTNNWFEMDDFLKDGLMAYITCNPDLKSSFSCCLLDFHNYSRYKSNAINIRNYFPNGHVVGDFAREIKRAYETITAQTVETIQSLCVLLNVPTPEQSYELRDRWRAIIKTYPLLKVLQYEGLDLANIAEYVQLLDSKRILEANF